ncbi:hypothetical protein Sste5346_004443 [Sporothrix stenoceras]|uniref:F-box domain-containing protein n=1 Tax=Sporothrix stenoceras TaxID=5173 RepID=A0ABR3Z8Y4_9PEZI
MKITDLPSELINLVVAELARDDLKPLRLTHSIFINATERRLFTTVVISKTKRDLASLLGIAGTPRLAVIPTRLVWYELTEDHNHHLRMPKEKRSIRPSYSERVQYMLHDLIADSFWTEPFLADDDPEKYDPENAEWMATKEALYLSRREASQAATEKVIGEAVRQLVKIHTLVAQPMPIDRVLAVSDSGYHLDGEVLKNVMDGDAAYPPNGLFLFSRACLGDDLTNRIRSLYLSGPFTRPNVFARYYGASDDGLALFTNLTTIDLCMSWMLDVQISEGQELWTSDRTRCLPMAKCLQSASKLQHLTICFEAQPDQHTKRGLLDTVLFTDVGQEENKKDKGTEEGKGKEKEEETARREQDVHGGQQPLWPMLHSLHLVDALYEEKQIVDFVARHAATLRHLGLMDCLGHSTLIAAELAAIPRLQLSSFKVRSYMFYRGHPHTAREDYLVSEEALLAFVNKESSFNPVAKTKRKVFSTGPFIWDPRSWPAVAYFDLAASHTRHTGPKGDVPGLGLPGELGIDLGHQDEIMSAYSGAGDIRGENQPPQADHDGWYYATDSSEAEIEYGMDDMQDDDGAWPPRRNDPEVPLPYDAVDRAWITAWAKQTAHDEDINLDLVTAEPLGRDEPKWKAPFRQSLLLSDRAADIRHMERCRGENTEASPRWCWMRINSHQADSDDMSQEIYYWKTKVPGQGNPTTNWTFYKTFEDGTARHGFGADPLDFFSEWDSDSDKEYDRSDSDESDEDKDEGKAKKDTMHAEASVYSRAFKRFLANPFDRGDPLEADVDVIRLELVDDSEDADEDENEDNSGMDGQLRNVRNARRAEVAARKARNQLLDAARGHTVKGMLLVGVTADLLPAKVGMLVPKKVPPKPAERVVRAAQRSEASTTTETAATTATTATTENNG